MSAKIEAAERYLSKDEQAELDDLREEIKTSWPKILDEITMDSEYKEASSAIKWLRRVLDENVPYGKHGRGIASALFFRELKPERTPEEEFETHILAWCLEIVSQGLNYFIILYWNPLPSYSFVKLFQLQTASLIADDIMDGSETRRGMPCWYKQEGVGMTAVNDCFLLENLVYEVLHKYFRNKDYYPNIVRLLQKTAYRTILGQNLDTRVGIDKNIHE